MNNLSVLFYYHCHHGLTNIYAQAQVSTQFKIWCCFISKHHPLKPLKLTKLAYVRYLSGHNSLQYLPIQFINADCSITANIGLKFWAIIPKPLQVARLKELSIGIFFSSLISYSAAFNHVVNGSVCSGEIMPPWFPIEMA